MAIKNIFAVGRIIKGSIEVHVAPSLHERGLDAAQWFGQQDARSGQPCRPEKYFITPEMQRAYIDGWNS